MTKFGLLLLLILVNQAVALGQRENALPLGPSVFTQKLVDKKSNPIIGAKITITYPDGKQRPEDTFVSDSNGRFSAYIYRYDQAYIDLKISYKNKVIKTIRYTNTSRGMNIGIGEPSIRCVIKRKYLPN